MSLLRRLCARFPSLANPSLDSTNYDVRVRPARRHPLLFVVRKIATQLLFAPFYLMLVLPLAAAGAAVWIWRLSSADRKRIRTYCEPFWYYPSLCIHKIVEGGFFGTVPVAAPSCDIGCEDGVVTSLHFRGALFDVGVEYVLENRPIGGYRAVVVAGLPHLPQDWTARFRTVALVHVIDHVRELEASLRDIRRVTMVGGRVFISGLADGYPRHVRNLSLGLLDERWLGKRKGLHHFLTIPEWRACCSAAGFRVLRLEGFLGGWQGRLWVLLHTFFEINGSNDLFYAADRLALVPSWARTRIFVPFSSVLAALFLHAPAGPAPCHFYAELEASA